MIDTEQILASARKTIQSESDSIAALAQYIDNDFVAIAQLVFNTNARVIVTGIGKSALIAAKIVATLNSTGTPSQFLHAAEAIHGDLGMVQPGDVVICISKSGNSPEIKVLAPLLKRFGNVLVGMTANKSSFLAQESDYVLHAYVEAEACPLNLAPTNSTTAQLVMGDALAISLMELRGFTAEDFAKYHPGGALGKKLLLRVGDMLDETHRPEVAPTTAIKEAIHEISAKRLGVTAVIENGKLVGIITDGDIRRMLNDRDNIAGVTAADVMTRNPKTVASHDMVVDAFNTMENHSITQLMVVDGGVYKGVLHIHDILKEGVI
ncbi:D-arabinose 5-phosphate isomerase [Flavobacterium akiainvivens]|uniref:D-arabinose 5-phosphate isomerase n=1 Tax=Flavobacterium akiainvivens TaxID=1202724 RepID=A0A0M8MIN1_9FLAO|nr:KpsF/GutQ family sugar-phosphate isomerase [Flavobacterium akiainvivens]KOS06348.1 D-arabinose 5-phosphate isomerase [Flavobacterium akiainvivens]SFQ15604.1 arabinose-5-phosphate isomerase [Flavobacterium akiainvivens]